jgi:hypothetical protein
MAVSEIRKRIVENGNQKVLDDQVIFDKTIEMLVADAK